MAGITSLFTEPFYTGSVQATSGVVPWELEVAIGGHAYKINVAEYQRQTLPYLRQPQDNEADAGEQSLATEGWWKRTVTDWSLGAGQRWADDPRIEGSPRRFLSSGGIDPWTPGELKLLPGTNQLRDDWCSQVLFTDTGYMYVYSVTSTTVEWATWAGVTAAPASLPPSWSNSALASSGSGFTYGNMIAVAGYVYLAAGTGGVRRTAVGSTASTTWCSHHADVVGYANGFMLIGDGPDIHTVTSTGGASSSLFTHWSPDFKWTHFVDTPTGILAIGYPNASGSGTSEFYLIGIDETTGSLKVPVSAGRLPEGQIVVGAYYYQGVLALSTSAGLRIAQIQNNGVIYGPTFGTDQIKNGYPSTFSGQGQYVYFDWPYMATPGSDVTAQVAGIGRLDLSSFTSPLVPAYASDVMVDTGGVIATAMAVHSTRRAFTTQDGVWISDPDRNVTEGWVISSRYRFGTQETKLLSSVDVRHDVLATGEAVEVLVATDDEGEWGTPTTWTSIGVSQTAGNSRPSTPFSAHATPHEYASVLVRITDTEDDRVNGIRFGRLFRWTARAAVTPFRQDEILVPILLFDAVDTNDEYGQDTYYDTLGEFQFLKDLETSRAVVSYQEGSATYQVVVDRVIVKPYSWNNGKTFFNGTVYVRLLTVEV